MSRSTTLLGGNLGIGGNAGAGGNPVVYPFTPLDYGPTKWWLRGDDMTLNGADVSSWNDKTGHGYHWAQGTAALQPAKSVASLNGRDGVLFTAASDEELVGPVLSTLGLTEAETYIVLKIQADPPLVNTKTGLWNAGSAGSEAAYPFTDGVIYDDFGTTIRKTTGNPALSLAVPRIYSVVTAAGEWTSYIDGVQHYTTAANVVGFRATPCKLGGSIVGNNFDGWMWEWFTYTAKRSAAQRTAIIAGLKAYYGGW